jgi:hypothetical protein
VLTTNELLSWVNECERKGDDEVRAALLDIITRREAGAYDGDRSGLASGLPGVGVADRVEISGD